MKRRRKVLHLILAFMLVSNFVYVYADTLEELKNRQKGVKNEINQKKNEIKALETEAKNVSKEIQDLDRKMDDANNQLEKVEDELKTLEENIENTLLELDEAEENIEEKDNTFKKRLRVMYKIGNAEYLEILLSSANIKDLLSRVDMVKAIAKHDTELIKYMKEQRDIIEAKKVELEMQRNAVEISKTKLESRRRDLAKATRAKEDYMSELNKNTADLEKEIDKHNDEAKALESEIIKLQRVEGPYTGGRMKWPVPGYNRISSYYGYRTHPILKTNKLHTGIDIPAPTGTSIVAAAGGTVIYSGNLGGYGKTIMIDHGGGIVTLYGHNSALVVKENQKVQAGDTIAKAGSTGMSTGPHCHFEVRKNGAYLDPMSYLKGK